MRSADWPVGKRHQTIHTAGHVAGCKFRYLLLRRDVEFVIFRGCVESGKFATFLFIYFYLGTVRKCVHLPK